MADLLTPHPEHKCPHIIDVEIVGGALDGLRQRLWLLSTEAVPRYLLATRLRPRDVWDAPASCDPAALVDAFHVFEVTGMRTTDGLILYRPWRGDGHRTR